MKFESFQRAKEIEAQILELGKYQAQAISAFGMYGNQHGNCQLKLQSADSYTTVYLYNDCLPIKITDFVNQYIFNINLAIQKLEAEFKTLD